MKFSFKWNSGSATTADLRLKDLQTPGRGNDFAIDTIALDRQPSIVVKPPANQNANAGQSKSISFGTFTQTDATGPFKVHVNWGDGSAQSVLSVLAAGTIPSTLHSYPKGATYTVTEAITDAVGNVSNTATFHVVVAPPTVGISGVVFDDVNGNGTRDAHESGLGLFTVYIDLNQDGRLDTGDVQTTTNVFGAWSFQGLAAGTYRVRIAPVTGFSTTTPGGGVLTISLSAFQVSNGNLFGARSVV